MTHETKLCPKCNKYVPPEQTHPAYWRCPICMIYWGSGGGEVTFDSADEPMSWLRDYASHTPSRTELHAAVDAIRKEAIYALDLLGRLLVHEAYASTKLSPAYLQLEAIRNHLLAIKTSSEHITS